MREQPLDEDVIDTYSSHVLNVMVQCDKDESVKGMLFSILLSHHFNYWNTGTQWSTEHLQNGTTFIISICHSLILLRVN